MIYFPQLSTGATGQFPIRKRRAGRTAVNIMPDGRTIKYADTGADLVEWRLQYEGLSDAEADSIRKFFESAEGRLNGFTLLDPADNLLAWSESLDQPAWEASSLLQIQSGIADPMGTSRATRITNNSQADLSLQQVLNAPGWFSYCFSLYARADQNTSFHLNLQTEAAIQTSACQARDAWQRFSTTSKFNTSAESITAGLSIAPGNTTDIFGPQVEAQPGASAYKVTQGSGGIYATARFDADSFTLTTTAPNRNACQITLVAPPN